MQRISSVSSNRVWLGALTLAAVVPFTGVAMGQKKSSPAPAPARSAPAKPAPARAPANAARPGAPGAVRPGAPGSANAAVRPGAPGSANAAGRPGAPGSANAAGRPGAPGSANAAGRPGAPGATGHAGAAQPRISSPNLPVGTTKTANGSIKVEPNGTRTQYVGNRPVAMQKPNLVANYGANGRPSMVRSLNPATNTLQVVHHGPGGIRTAQVTRPAAHGGVERVVSRGPRSGYLERPVYNRNGFVRRSYIVGDRRYAVNYRSYHYNGVAFYRPVPVVVYSPLYYGWAAQSWGAPVVIGVGFSSQPWYGAYGGAFVPYGQYSSADQWMTDQMLASNMQAAYDAGRDAGAQSASADVSLAPPTISPELKQQFNAQVKLEVQEQGQQAQGGVAAVDPPPVTENEPDQMPDALKPGHTAFRVVEALDVESDGDACTLNTDDWIVRNGVMGKDGTILVTVAASRSTDCAQGSTTSISLNDLMTMQNEQNQQIQDALQLASVSMGKNGMPAGPAAGAITVPGGKAQPDVDVALNLQKEQQDANSAEAQAVARRLLLEGSSEGAAQGLSGGAPFGGGNKRPDCGPCLLQVRADGNEQFRQGGRAWFARSGP